jgi:ABC-type transport system involved in cytochrome c biogenesis permease component|tara:strand:+ start:1132 stop:1380 length:249 start_codon:yes stop_codon:yes gene_type:complete
MDYLIAFWLSAWLIVIWKLVIPAFAIATLSDKDNAVLKHKKSVMVLVSILAIPLTPLLMFAAFDVGKHRERFIRNFVIGLLG